MDLYLKQTLRAIVFKGVLLSLLCLLIYLTEFFAMGPTVYQQQTGYVAGLFVLFFMFSALSYFIYMKVLRKGGKMVFAYYMLSSIVRLFVTVTVLVVYVVIVKENLWAFDISIIAFYIVELVTSIRHYTKMERLSSKQKD